MSGRSQSFRLGLAIALAALAACKGVGRELVGQASGARRGVEECGLVPLCSNDPLPPPPVELPPAAEPVELIACGGPPAQVGCTASSGPGQIAGGGNGCEAAEPIDVDGEGEEALSEVVCDSVRVSDHRSAPAQRVLRVMGAHLESANVGIQSDLPLTVELVAASLSQVWFELDGPVTLRFEDSQMFANVRISSTGPGPAAVELDSVRGGPLALGAEAPSAADDSIGAAAFAGAVSIWRSSLNHARIEAGTIAVESSSLADLAFAADSFQAVDSTLNRMTVDARHIQLSACAIQGGDFSECDTFSALTGVLLDSRIEPCERGVRLYGVNFRSGSIEGRLVLDRAVLTDTRLGMHELTEIAAWDTSLTRVRFCEQAVSISFGAKSSVDCTSCDATRAPCSIGVCVLTTAMFEVSGLSKTSPEFQTAAAMPGTGPACVLPEPTRMRPPLF